MKRAIDFLVVLLSLHPLRRVLNASQGFESVTVTLRYMPSQTRHSSNVLGPLFLLLKGRRSYRRRISGTRTMPAPTDLEYWPPRAEDRAFDWSQPTCDVYEFEDNHAFSEPFRESRSKLDYSYHKNPILDRQLYQDMVLARILEADSDDPKDSSESAIGSEAALKSHRRPLLVFTSGPMGVGKSYVLSQLHQRGIFPLHQYVKIDPDMVKSELPEMAGYLQHDSESAATKLHRESTQMSDVLFEHSLMNDRNILVDGSLRDTEWYQTLFDRIRKEFPQYVLCILYVSASPETIKDRAHQRAAKTGRTVPEDLLQDSIEQVPRSVEALSPLTDYTFEITNDDGQPMSLKQWPSKGGDDDKSEPTWEYFGRIWREPTELESKENEDGRQEPLFCHMMEHLSCPIQSEQEFDSAKIIWGTAYPSFCPRCTLACDHQCGVCIHGNHKCYCEQCKNEPSCR